MTGIKRNGIDIKVVDLENGRGKRLYIDDDCEEVSYQIAKMSNEGAELFIAVLDYVCFGNNEDRARGLLRELKYNGENEK